MDDKTFLIILIIFSIVKFGSSSSAREILKNLKLEVDDELCKSQVESYFSSLATDEAWAVDMFYASSNFEKEFFYGNSWDFGDIDRCLQINFNEGVNKAKERINGKYCMIQYYATNRTIKAIPPVVSIFNRGWKNLDKRFGGAICIPRSCPSSIIPAIMEKIFNGTDLKMSTDYDDQESYCKTSEVPAFVTIDYVATVIIVGLLSLLIASTVYDLREQTKNVEKNQLFISFSLYTNLKDVFKMQRNGADKAISYLSGMKALSYFAIIFLHTHFFRINFPLHDPSIMEVFDRSSLSEFLMKLTLAVDTFLLISGFLITRTIFRELNNGSFSVLKTYFRRYMRITPILILTLPILFLSVHFKPATPYSFPKNLIGSCKIYWWSYFLHIQNYANVHEQCNPASWYLSVDYQMFLLTPLIVYLIWKWNWTSFIVFPILLAGIHYLTYLRTVILLPTFEGFSLSTNIYGEIADLYHQTQFRGSPWIVGIMVGVLTSKYAKLKLPKLVSIVMWTITCSIGVLIWIPDLMEVSKQPELQKFSFHFVYHFYKLWAFAVAWIILACHYEYSPKVNWFLSLTIWMPVEKIGLSLYLMHTLTVVDSVVSQKQPIDFDGSVMISKYISDCSIGLLTGLIYHLSIEKPFTLIGKHLSKNW